MNNIYPSMKKNETASPELIRELNKSTDLVSSLIHDYLLKKEYLNTLDAFQCDIISKLQHKKYYKAAFLNITENNLIKSLSQGNKNDFFNLWNRIIPNHIKLREQSIEKIEFYIQIYFAIFPALYNQQAQTKKQTLKQSMEEFKQYLELKQNDLSKTSEFLNFYALPYIPNPQTHPNYK
jgi:hypothetical protein